MIPKKVFYDRRDNHCLKCEYWKGACLKGHALTSPQGCPIHKFEPVSGADYAADVPAKPAPEVPQPGACCGAKEDGLKPLSWAQAVAHLTESTAKWKAAGFQTTTTDVYRARVSRCQDSCPHYSWFQCRLCKCAVFVKAMVPHEKCPDGRWKV